MRIDVEKAIEAKRQEIEAKTGLLLSWIRTTDELTRVLDEGLTELYQQVFADFPYNEKFSVEEVKSAFEATLNAGGLIFTASAPDNRKTIAFVSSVPLRAEPSISDVVKSVVDLQTTSYFSEDGVAQAWRRQNISTNMKDMLLTANYLLGYDNVILRTSLYNYPQIASVSKSGGVVISEISQDVESKRGDGTISSDKRIFYLFDLEAKKENNAEIFNRVTVARPGGNDTAIVWDYVPRASQGAVSLNIQKIYPGVEQVMFVEKQKNTQLVRGQMAGGEFCGNATRSLGYLLLGAKDGSVDVEISGATRPLNVEVRNGFSKTQIPILNNLECIKSVNGTGEYVAKLEGISFLIAFKDTCNGKQVSVIVDLEKRKQQVLNILREYKLSDEPASGLLVLNRKENGDIYLDPYVYVRDTGTLYYESGCGSGSTAVGLMLAKQSGASIVDQKIIQPSGMGLYVSVDRNEKAFLSATVSGPIELLLDGKMYLSKKWREPKLAFGS